MSQPPLQNQPPLPQGQPPPPQSVPPPSPPRREWSRLIFWATLIVIVFDILLLVALIFVAYGRVSTGDLAPPFVNPTPTVTALPTARPTPTAVNFANTRTVVTPLSSRVPTVTAGTPATTKGRVGETLVQNGYVLIVNQVQRADIFQPFSKAKDGNIYIALDLTIQSSKDNGVQVNALNCSLKDSQGFKYNIGVFGKDPALASQNDLPRGDKIRGWVTFEVPKTASGLTFEYRTLLGDVFLSVSLDN